MLEKGKAYPLGELVEAALRMSEEAWLNELRPGREREDARALDWRSATATVGMFPHGRFNIAVVVRGRRPSDDLTSFFRGTRRGERSYVLEGGSEL